jgi:uncharacterized ion transporter superfamily protein YfcC
MKPGAQTNETVTLVKWILIVFLAVIAIWTAATYFMPAGEAEQTADVCDHGR